MAKILIHTLVFTPDGVSNAYLYRDLARELVRRGHQITVLTTTPHYNQVAAEMAAQPMVKRLGGIFRTSSLGGIRVIHIRVPRKSSGALMRTAAAVWFHLATLLSGVFLIGRHDVVLASSPPLTIGLIGKALAFLWGGRSAYIVQDVFPDGLIRQGKIRSPLLISSLGYIEKLVYGVNDRVVVIADSFAKIVRPRMRDPKKLRLIENFVDTEFYRPLPRHNEFSRAHSFDDRFVVSYIGNIGNAQDLRPVLEAAKELRNLPIRFVLVGDGIRRAQYDSEAHDLGLTNVVFLGYIPYEETPWANASCDLGLVLLSPHVKDAGFPSKIYSIMSCGRAAVITADEGSDLRRIVRESGWGRIVRTEAYDEFIAAVRRAYEEREVLAAEGAVGRAYVEKNCSRAAAGAKYDRLISELSSVQGQLARV